ncbi:MAG TPA: hypothetical protein VJT69_08045 [Pyrinomonadaceae bacterium]|nr:hypothetical protein [Pyrinomonadaceae bacterium]
MKRTGFCHYAMAALVCLTSFTIALAQKPTHPEADAKKESKPAARLPFELTVKTRPILNISLKAEKAKVSEVTQELSKRLKVPIFLGTERQNELLTIEFSQLTLEPALQLMSPTVYVDYEISSDEQPKALAIYLYDANQGEPPLTAVNGSTQSMLIEGNTEDGVEPESEGEEKEKSLQIHLKDNLLTVKAKKQPLSLVLLKIGEELGIPVDIQELTTSIVDADISKLPVEDAVRQLSPNIRLFLRADLTRAERRALRLVLAEPAKTTQQNP